MHLYISKINSKDWGTEYYFMLEIIYQKLGIQVCNLKASYSNNFPKMKIQVLMTIIKLALKQQNFTEFLNSSYIFGHRDFKNDFVD